MARFDISFRLGVSRRAYVEQRRTSLTCLHGHAWANNTLFEYGQRKCKECRRIYVRNAAKRRVASKERVARVLDGLSHGLTLNQMTASNCKRGVWRPHDGIKRIVKYAQITNFMRAHPTLGKKMKALSKKNSIQNRCEACRSLQVIAAPALLSNNGVDAFEAVQLATAAIWEDDRGDVQTLMWLAIGENKLKLSDCTPEKAREYLKIHRRRPNVYGSYSLDTPIGEDSGMTWLDTKTDEDRLWA